MQTCIQKPEKKIKEKHLINKILRNERFNEEDLNYIKELEKRYFNTIKKIKSKDIEDWMNKKVTGEEKFTDLESDSFSPLLIIQARLDKITNDLTDLHKNVSSLEKEISIMKEDNKSIKKDIEKISNIGTTTLLQNKDIENLFESEEELKKSISKIENEISELKSSLSKIEKKISSIETNQSIVNTALFKQLIGPMIGAIIGVIISFIVRNNLN